MSTFLQLCKYTCRECGVTGGEAAISAVASQTGELGRIVAWVANCWNEIQNKHPNWRWMRHGFTVDTVADDDTYAYGDVTDTTTSSAITRLGRWWVGDPEDCAKIYLTSAGVGTQGYLTFLPWEHFKAIYRIGTQNSGPPAHITIDPQNRLVLGPKPDGIYTVTGDYQRSAQTLSADADEPEMPTQFHNLIVYRAMEDHGFYESAPEVLGRGKSKGTAMMRALQQDQLPEPRLPPPLA